jgi:hypothetical protein
MGRERFGLIEAREGGGFSELLDWLMYTLQVYILQVYILQVYILENYTVQVYILQVYTLSVFILQVYTLEMYILQVYMYTSDGYFPVVYFFAGSYSPGF